MSIWQRITQWVRPRGYPANLDWLGSECITETPEMTEEELAKEAVTHGMRPQETSRVDRTQDKASQ